MDFSKLSQIDIKDLKNINVAQIKEILQSRLDILLSVALIAGTILATTYIYTSQQNKAQRLNNDVRMMSETLDAVKINKEAQKKFDDFLAIVPKSIEYDDLVELLSEFAVDHNVRILSFSPAQEKTTDFVVITSVNVDVSSEEFKDIVLFLKGIEDAPYTLRVDKFSASMATPAFQQRGGPAPESNKIEAEITIASIKLKKELDASVDPNKSQK
jgi:Tfp pilus assembly protein PilO